MDLLLFEVLEAASLDATPWPQSIAQYIHVYAQLSLNSVNHVDWPDGLCRRDPRVHLESRLIPPVTNRTNKLVAAAVSFINPTSERAGGREKFSWLRSVRSKGGARRGLAEGSVKVNEWQRRLVRVREVAVGMWPGCAASSGRGRCGDDAVASYHRHHQMVESSLIIPSDESMRVARRCSCCASQRAPRK